MERIDELQRDGLKLIQDPDCFCFGTDAVLLADFASARPGEKVMDLCAASSVVSTLMYARCPEAFYTGLEIQPKQADMGRRSIKMNGLSGRLTMVEGDLRKVETLFPRASFDVVTANPPYMPPDSLKAKSEEVAIARSEICCTLEDVIRAASYLLKYHGRFYIVYKPSRLAELFEKLLAYRLEPKTMQLVFPYKDREPEQVLIGASKQGGRQMRILPPLITYEKPGVYTRQMLQVYGQDGHHLPLADTSRSATGQ